MATTKKPLKGAKPAPKKSSTLKKVVAKKTAPVKVAAKAKKSVPIKVVAKKVAATPKKTLAVKIKVTPKKITKIESKVVKGVSKKTAVTKVTKTATTF